jgi:hypothetical protein
MTEGGRLVKGSATEGLRNGSGGRVPPTWNTPLILGKRERQKAFKTCPRDVLSGTLRCLAVTT